MTIAPAIAALAKRALQPADPVRIALLDGIAASSGLHPTSLDRLVELWAEAWQADGAVRCLRRGLGHLPAGSFRPAGTVGVVAPGNLCVATWQAVLEPLLAGNRVRVRPGSGDRLAPTNLRTALAMVAPHLAERVDIAPFDRGAAEGWRGFFAGLDALAIYGGDAAIAAVLRLAGEAGYAGPVRSHGDLRSIAIVTAEVFEDPCAFEAVAAGLAHDALLADGRGCMSLRTVFALGDHGATRWQRAHAQLAGALEAGARRFPAGALAPTWQAATALEAEEHAFAAAGDPQRAFARGADWWLATAWNRRESEGLSQPLGPAGRGLVLHAAADWRALAHRLAPWRGRLSTVALSGPSAEAARLVNALGVHRLCRPGRMQAPPADRAPDGHAPLLGFVRLVDDEVGA